MSSVSSAVELKSNPAAPRGERRIQCFREFLRRALSERHHGLLVWTLNHERRRFDANPPAMSASAHVYADGSVLVASGGLEMGQGLYTKVKQVGPRAGFSDPRIVCVCTNLENCLWWPLGEWR